MKKIRRRNLEFVVFLVALSVGIYFFLDFLPSYSKLSVVFLILPSIFFIFRDHEHIDRKKLLVTLILGVLATIVWDTVAIRLNIWGFPAENTIGYFLGIPWEEYIFALFFITMSIGIYTSLPRFREHRDIEIPRLRAITLLAIVFILQLGVLAFALPNNLNSYLLWLAVLAIIPSFFFMFRRGEKIDEVRLLISVVLMIVITVVIDYIFIPGGAWFHHQDAILGTVGIVPVEDILFGIFNAIVIIGFYTSVPHKQPWTGRWPT